MDQCFLCGFSELWEDMRSLFYWVWNVFAINEGEENILILWRENINIFITDYELEILKNRNRFTVTY